MSSSQERWKVHDYFLLLLCKSSIWFTEKHIFKIIIYFFNTSKCAANYVISFEVYDGFIGQKILKLWRQESWPFCPGWAANIPRIHSWTSNAIVTFCWNRIKVQNPSHFCPSDYHNWIHYQTNKALHNFINLINFKFL